MLNVSSTASTGIWRSAATRSRSSTRATIPSYDRKITYRELHEQVCRLANVLRDMGVKKGDRVTIYLPMIPEAAYAMLACARIGAIHSVVFGGFSPDSLADRIEDCASKLRDHRRRRAARRQDRAAEGECRRGADAGRRPVDQGAGLPAHRPPGADGTTGRDHSLNTLMRTPSPVSEPEPMNAEDPLFILYTSGSTGKPKGVLHTTGGYLVYARADASVRLRLSRRRHLLVHRRCRLGHRPQLHRLRPAGQRRHHADVRGHPDLPRASRGSGRSIDKHKVNIFYTAPTAIRALMRDGDEPVRKTSRKSLRLLGTVGEPINPEAWLWYHRVVGDGRCPIVDTWWQTETGGILITPLPGAIPTEARLGDAAVLRRPAGAGRRRRQPGRRPRRGQPRHHRQLARPDAHRVRRPRALRPDLFLDLQGHLLHRRRRAARRGRLLLDHRPRRRRDQRLRPPHGHRRDRERPGRRTPPCRRPPSSAARTT